MIASNAQNPNCMYLWMDHMMAPKTQATVAEGFGEAPVNLKACELTKNPNHCTSTTPTTSPGGRTSTTGTRRPRTAVATGGTCVTQEDWRNAWTEIRGLERGAPRIS